MHIRFRQIICLHVFCVLKLCGRLGLKVIESFGGGKHVDSIAFGRGMVTSACGNLQLW